jgi:hypothetical protein
MRAVDRIAGPNDEVGMVAWKEQNLLMSPRPLTDFGFRASSAEQFERAVAWLREAPERRWIFARHEEVHPCLDERRTTLAGYANRRRWTMFRLDAVRPDCQLPPPPGAVLDDDTD